MREAYIVLMTGQIGLCDTVSRTVIAASLEDALVEFDLALKEEADRRGKWHQVTKAEVAGRCQVTRLASTPEGGAQ